MTQARTFPITRIILLALGSTAAMNGVVAETDMIDGADSGWRAVAACAAESSEKARHACLDDVLRRAGLLTSERETRQQREGFGASPKASTPPAAPSTLEVELARVSTTHDEKLILTTTDGAVWRQIEGTPIRPVPAAGDRMTIRRASMGSFLCEVRRNVGFRCSRSR
jgi:hypothetical protein